MQISLLSKNPSILEFKESNLICMIKDAWVNNTMKEEACKKEIENEHWISVHHQLDDKSHILIKETIEVDLSDDLKNLKIVSLEKTLNAKEQKKIIEILKER